MPSPLITIKNLYLQKDFPEETKKWLRALYGTPADEEFLCAVWTNPILRKGFLLTDKALRWYVTADGKKLHGSLLKDVSQNTNFTITKADELLRLEITADKQTYTFFITALTEEKGTNLCDVLKFGYGQNEIPQTDLNMLIKSMSFLNFRNLCDGALNKIALYTDKIGNITKRLAKKILGLMKTSTRKCTTQAETEAGHTENTNEPKITDTIESERTSATKTNITVQKGTSFGERILFILLNTLDICASLVFLAAIIIILKPELLQRFVDTDSILKTLSENQNSIFWKIGDFTKALKESYDSQLGNLQHGFVGISLIVYATFKLIVLIGLKTNKQKIVSTLLVGISLFAVFLVVDRFALFIPFCLLAYLAFEYSCGIQTKSILIKLLIIFILTCSGYITSGILADPKALESYHVILEKLAVIKDSLRLRNRIIWW